MEELARLDEFVAMPRLCSRSTFLRTFENYITKAKLQTARRTEQRQTVNVSQHEVIMSESKAEPFDLLPFLHFNAWALLADSCSLCDASHSGSRAAAPSATLLIPSRAQREARSATPHKVVAAFELPRAQQASSSCRFWKTGPSATWRAL